MIRRDGFWRGLGAVLLMGGCGGAYVLPTEPAATHDALTLLCMGLAILGIVLIAQGRKAVLALRIETSPHRMLPELIRTRRRQRRLKRRS